MNQEPFWLFLGRSALDIGCSISARFPTFSFTTDQPDGSAVPLPPATPGGGGLELRRQLRLLKEFVHSFDFIRMSPANGLIKERRIIGSGTVRILAETGKAYAIYVNGGTRRARYRSSSRRLQPRVDKHQNRSHRKWRCPQACRRQKATHIARVC